MTHSCTSTIWFSPFFTTLSMYDVTTIPNRSIIFSLNLFLKYKLELGTFQCIKQTLKNIRHLLYKPNTVSDTVSGFKISVSSVFQ